MFHLCPIQVNTLFSRQHNVIPVLADILSDTVKEKVSRIVLATFRVCVTYCTTLCIQTLCVLIYLVYLYKCNYFMYLCTSDASK